MAIETTLEMVPGSHDESAEEAFERAVMSWRAARARLESVDPDQLSVTGRAAYFRLLARIGLWSDARMESAAAAEAVDESDAFDGEM